MRAPESVGDMGIADYFKEPEGNVLGLRRSLAGSGLNTPLGCPGERSERTVGVSIVSALIFAT